MPERQSQETTTFGFITDKPSKYLNLTPTEIIERGLEVERTERIPVGNIVLESAIIDEDHIDILTSSLRGKRGQISPLTVRARLADKTLIHYDVIDGFHRSYAIVNLGWEFADAKVLYGCSDEELYDLRVLSSSVKSVEFSRLTVWMNFSFAQTEWAKRGLSLPQIFSLAVFDTDGSRLGLTFLEAKKAKMWAEEKSKLWNRPIASIWEMARSTAEAAPDLVAQVRGGRQGGRNEIGLLTPARFRAIVLPLSGEFDLQRKVAKVVLENNLSADKATALANLVSDAKEHPTQVGRILRDSYLNRGVGVLRKRDIKQTHGILDRKKDKDPYWFNRFPLTEKEKEALLLTLINNLDLQSAAMKMKVSQEEFFDIFRKAVKTCLANLSR